MPYAALTDLPASVRDTLSKHAQEIYRVAWAAVGQKYEKDDTGKWRAK